MKPSEVVSQATDKVVQPESIAANSGVTPSQSPQFSQAHYIFDSSHSKCSTSIRLKGGNTDAQIVADPILAPASEKSTLPRITFEPGTVVKFKVSVEDREVIATGVFLYAQKEYKKR